MAPSDPSDFLDLQPIAAECACMCVRRDLVTQALNTQGFIEVVSVEDGTPDHWRTYSWPMDANALIIIARNGDENDITRLKDICHLLAENNSSPTLLAVLLPSYANANNANTNNANANTATDEGGDNVDIELVDMLLDEGYDDVMTLRPGEQVTSARVRTAMLRTDKLGEKSQAIVGQVKASAHVALENANRRFLWNLPGKTLENIPPRDNTLEEVPGSRQARTLGRVGGCEFTCVLGEGSLGVVYKCDHPQRGTLAIKVIAKSSVKNTQALFSLDREFNFMCNLPHHPNVVHASGAMHGRVNLYLVMGFGGMRALHNYHLKAYEDTKRGLPEGVVANFMQQELGAVVHLHRNRVCHRDLKPSNFILSDDGTCLKLADFGLAMLVVGPGQLLGDACGSLPFCAPEVLETLVNGRRYDGFLADSWSLAVNFYELACGPFSVEKLLGWVPTSPPCTEGKIRDLKYLGPRAIATLPDFIKDGYRSAITGMFTVEPDQRWSAVEAYGPMGLNAAAQEHSEGDPPMSPLLTRRSSNTMQYVSKQGIASRALLASMLRDIQSQTEETPLTQRRTEVMHAFRGLPAKILADPVLGPFHERDSISKSSCGIVMSLYPQVSSGSEEERRRNLRAIHANMEITDHHFDVLLNLIREQFTEAGLAPDIADEAMTKIENLRSDICLQRSQSEEPASRASPI